MKTNISVVGSIALDTLETPKGNRREILGGSATYFSIAASKFAPVEVIGIVGSDFPQSGWDVFKQNNIDCENIIIESGNTFQWGGKYNQDYSKRDTLFTNLGVFENFIPQIKNTKNKNGILFLANIHPSLQLDVLNKMSNNVSLVVSDTMNLWIDLDLKGLKKVISKSNIFLLNDEEARQLTNINNLENAGKTILDMGPNTVIIKMGGEGSLLITNNDIIEIPCVPNIDVYDPTGAGDSFAGGLIGYISEYGNDNMLEALLYASATASFTVSDFGINQILHLNLSDIEKRVEILKKLI
tara:strand:+ start:7106 stop:7999 length:894 start_codon:yes stop_codon:yes gene_type:complete